MTTVVEGESSSQQYIVHFSDNSKCWNRKEVWLDPEILDKLYDKSELFDGANVIVPWKGKGGKISHWNAVFINWNAPRHSNDNCNIIMQLTQ